MNAIDEVACCRPGCDNLGKPGCDIVGHGWFVTKSGRRRRYRCNVCGGTLSTNTGTAYRGLRCTRREFDQVAGLRVEGVSISATARVTGHSRNTIALWPERAAAAAERFNHRMSRDFDIMELQADELCTSIGNKSKTLWLFATIEVCSRLWAGCLLVRGFRDAEHLVRRAPQPHDSARVGVLAPALALPRPWRRPTPRARRAPALLLQFHPAAPSVAVRARDQDASDAGRAGAQAIGLERHLHSVRFHAACCCRAG
mgnify:CR=1 FL=1